MPEIRHGPKPCKTNWNHKAHRKFKIQGQEEASFDNSVKGNKPTRKPGTHGGRSNRQNLDKPQWNHEEYKKYEVQSREGNALDLANAVSGGAVAQSDTRASILTTLCDAVQLSNPEIEPGCAPQDYNPLASVKSYANVDEKISRRISTRIVRLAL